MPKKSWDRGIPYKQIRERLLMLIDVARHQVSLGYKRARKRLANLYVLLTQLDNASRVSEAFEAYLRFVETGEREIEVRVRKQRKDPEFRVVMIPPEVPDPPDAPRPTSLAAVKVFAQSIGLNTHTLRYARITDLAKRQIHPAMIGRITEHRNLNLLIRYIQKEEARRTLRRLIFGEAG